MTTTDRALLSQKVDGRWALVVVLLGVPGSKYPEFIWPKDAPAPTPADRRTVLADLGYQVAPGAEWQWCEAYPDPDHDTTAVELIAATDVHRAGGEPR
jgi:hypothetical protein